MPMHYACVQGHKEIVDILRKNGASFCAKGKAEWTPLHFACESGHVEIVLDILQSGVDVNVQVFVYLLNCFMFFIICLLKGVNNDFYWVM